MPSWLPSFLSALALMAVPPAQANPGPGTAPMSAAQVRQLVDDVVRPLMATHDIPGMSVGVAVKGETQVFHYGVIAKGEGQPVTDLTLFEIGSLSKTLTATLGAWAAAKGELDLTDAASRHWPALAGTVFDRISLLALATYTAGGLPLQFPETVRGDAGILTYFQQWQPQAPPGHRRQYSNPSIGLFGWLAGQAGHAGFDTAMTRSLLPALGLQHTYLQVPADQQAHYAYGVAQTDGRVRVSSGPLDAEAYGIKTTAADMIRFVQLAMQPSSLAAPLQQALDMTQRGYFQVGPMRQGLGWEIYAAPVTLDAVLAGNAPAMALQPQTVTAIPAPALAPGRFVNKTGSTRGFGAYGAFWPDEGLGIVLLANRNYPNAERIQAAWAILQGLRERGEAGDAGPASTPASSAAR